MEATHIRPLRSFLACNDSRLDGDGVFSSTSGFS